MVVNADLRSWTNTILICSFRSVPQGSSLPQHYQQDMERHCHQLNHHCCPLHCQPSWLDLSASVAIQLLKIHLKVHQHALFCEISQQIFCAAAKENKEIIDGNLFWCCTVYCSTLVWILCCCWEKSFKRNSLEAAALFWFWSALIWVIRCCYGRCCCRLSRRSSWTLDLKLPTMVAMI